MTGAEYVTQVRSYVGVPFRHCGRNRHGVDCVGLVVAAAHDLGLSDYVPRPYSRQVDSREMREQLEACAVDVTSQEKKPGDVLFLKVLGHPVHLGVFTGPTMIHSFEPAGKVCEVRWGDYWSSRVEAVFRWRGLD
jgi:cell wall-associated NlpC family hydrolase